MMKKETLTPMASSIKKSTPPPKRPIMFWVWATAEMVLYGSIIMALFYFIFNFKLWNFPNLSNISRPFRLRLR